MLRLFVTPAAMDTIEPTHAPRPMTAGLSTIRSGPARSAPGDIGGMPSTTTVPRRGFGWLFWVLLTLAAAVVGGLGSAAAPEFYGALAKPAWAPPAALFGPVWTVLYALMAAAAVLVWRHGEGPVRRTALILFAAQLGTNALWSWLFFTMRLPGVALADIAAMAVLLVVCVVWFARVRLVAGLLMVPVLGWVLFAGALNADLWWRNPAVFG
jgi:tryptophan-rich sensory protein